MSRDFCDHCSAFRTFSLVTTAKVLGQWGESSRQEYGRGEPWQGWKESNAVGEMASGTCAVERVREELPSQPADPDGAWAPVFAGTDPALVSTLTICSKDAGIQGSCGGGVRPL